jgi:hypothetical protein
MSGDGSAAAENFSQRLENGRRKSRGEEDPLLIRKSFVQWMLLRKRILKKSL